MFNIKNLKLPSSPGSYQFKDKSGKIIYIGKAANLRNRIVSYWQKGANHTPAKYSMMKHIASVEWIETESEIEALFLEANLIKKYQPVYNVDLKDDKRFLYIKVSTEDEIPGVFATRKVGRSGKYFGPFTSARAVRETLKAIRKIWPYCTEKRVKDKPCFYAQIGRCTGVCAGFISIKEYRQKIIKPIILFLEGKKKKIIKNYELEIKDLSAQGGLGADQEKELNGLKFRLLNIKKVLDHANILSIGEKYAADVVELAKILGLSRAPERIEGYDIANIFGHEAVGSMVVFKNGEPNKNEYRKFKIKAGQGGANDVGMLREILERRFKNNWPRPDLIIVDGGKAQLNAAVSVLKKLNLFKPGEGDGVMILAISKGEGLRSARARDKIFFPGENRPLELSLASPALHIIKRVRDEAHRFAINYHRLLRKKKMLVLTD